MSDTTFEAIYSQHGPAIYAFLRGLHGPDEHAALDSLQETFLKAYAAWSRFDPERPVLPWLFTIASRVRIDSSRRSRVETRDPSSHPTGSDDDVPERVALGDACGRLLHVAAQRLPARKLEAFLLARTQGLTYAEIAERRGCSPATVKRDVRDAAAVLSAAGTELGLAPAPTPVLTAAQLEAVLDWHEAFREHVNAIGALATADRPPTELLDNLDSFDDAWDEIEARLPGGEEELSWALGATLQACRALLPDSGSLWAELLQQADERVDAAVQKLERDPAEELQNAERQHEFGRAFFDAAEKAFLAAEEEDDDDESSAPEELAELARMRERTQAMIAENATRLAALRAGDSQEIARRRAKVERELESARARRDGLAALATRTRSARAATPNAHLKRVSEQLPRVARSLEYLLVAER